MIHLQLFIKSCEQFSRTGHFDPDSHRAVRDTTPATLAETAVPPPAALSPPLLWFHADLFMDLQLCSPHHSARLYVHSILL